MSIEVSRTRRNKEAVDAWTRARADLANGRTAMARFWLERVCRIAPNDWRPRFELALILGTQNDPEAPAALEAVARRFDYADAWLALARLHHRNRAAEAAAVALASLLRRHEVPAAGEGPRAFPPLAAAIAAAAGLPGWCGIAEGRVIASIGGVAFSADGTQPGAAPETLDGNDRLDVTHAGRPLLGSPLDLRAMRRHEGLATTDRSGGISGWIAHPAAPDRAPLLSLIDRQGTTRAIRPRRLLDPAESAPFLPRHGFRITPAGLRGLTPPFRIVTQDGAALYGTPIDPERLADLKPVVGRARRQVLPPRAPLCAVMPAYRDAAATAAAIASFHAASASRCPLVVVEDASPEPALTRLLEAEREAGRIVLVRHRRNRGFPAAVNSGIAAARRLRPGCDILLLNADILLPPGAPARLHAALYAEADIASATPFSNEATIMSYPSRRGGNPMPDAAETARLDALARRINRGMLVDIPTAIGFCMAIRHDALYATGRFDAAVFAQGYGEENDWCRRAAACGFRHVGVPSVFVAHRGSVSFGAAGAALCARNLDLLERMHPGYHALVEAHHAADPLREARFRLDRARFEALRGANGAAVLVSHDHGGGIARVVERRMAELRAAGIRPILIQPDLLAPDGSIRDTGPARLTDDAAEDYPALCFDPGRNMGGLLAILRRQGVRHVEFHHTLGHHPAIRTLADRLGVPAEHVIHDYAYFCKRVNLIGAARRYCGEPDVAGCEACIAEAGSELTDPVTPAALRRRSAAALRGARRVIAPSPDAASRMRRHFPGLAVTVEHWEDDSLLDPPSSPPEAGARRIAVVGGIGPAKGYDVLLACARNAAECNLALSFVLVGASEADDPLLETGRVLITGPYQEGEAPALIRRSGATLGFLPSIWPETWCFALSEMWRGGLDVIGFDLGAQGARIRASGWGAVLPLGLPVERINRTLLAWRPDLGNLGAGTNTRKLHTASPADLIS